MKLKSNSEISKAAESTTSTINTSVARMLVQLMRRIKCEIRSDSTFPCLEIMRNTQVGLPSSHICASFQHELLCITQTVIKV